MLTLYLANKKHRPALKKPTTSICMFTIYLTYALLILLGRLTQNQGTVKEDEV